jgi:hypothetical protein
MSLAESGNATSAYALPAPGGGLELAEAGDEAALQDVAHLRHLRRTMRCHATRNTTNKILLCVILAINPVWFTLLGLAIFDSLPISVVLGVYIYLVTLAWLLAPNVAAGKMHELLLENPKFAKEMNSETGKALWTFPFLIGCGIYPVVSFVIYRFLIADATREGGPIFGEEYSVLILVLISVWQSFSVFFMVYASVLIPGYRKFIADMMELKIREYIAKIAQELRRDVHASAEDILRRLAAVQRPAEEWARQIPGPWSKSNGASIILPLLGCSFFLLLLAFTDHAAIPATGTRRAAKNSSSSNSSTTSAISTSSTGPPPVPKERFVVLFGVACAIWSMYLFIKNLNHFSNPNRAWNSQVALKLNDAELVSCINRAFGNRVEFNMWLSAHRLSANRVLGMQLTTELMAKIGTVIGSGFSLAIYFLLRTELQTFL